MRSIAKASLVLGLMIGGAPAAFAADLPTAYKAPPPIAAPYNWTGLYVGGNVGGGWVNEDSKFVATTGVATSTLGRVYGTDRSAFLGGAQAGYNHQLGSWVVGIEGDFSWTDAKANPTTTGNILAATEILNNKTDWYATVAGRLGYALNNVLLYAKGGGAWSAMSYAGSVTFAGATTTYNRINTTRDGWMVGGGLEWGFLPNWSAKLEYNYLDFGTDRLNLTGVTPGAANITTTFDEKTTVNIVKVGLNYRF